MKIEMYRNLGFLGYPNYAVSRSGKIKSLNYRHTGKEKILIPNKTKFGYLRIGLMNNGKKERFMVHKLVALAFIVNPNSYPQVNHRNEIKSDNRVENLEWCDNKYNCNFGTRNERIMETRKTSENVKEGIKRGAEKRINGKRSKRLYQYSLENSLIDIFPSLSECGRNGYNFSSVSACCLGKRKTHKESKWSYEPPEKKTTLRRCSFGALTLKSYDIKKVG